MQQGKRKTKDKNWEDYPNGSRAYAVMGGYWEKSDRGWKHCCGSAHFGTPAAEATDVSEPLTFDAWYLELSKIAKDHFKYETVPCQSAWEDHYNEGFDPYDALYDDAYNGV